MVRRLVLDIVGAAIIRQGHLESAARPQKMYSPRIVFLVTYFGGNFYIEWSALVGALGDNSNWQGETLHTRRVQFLLIRFSTKRGVNLGQVEEHIFVCSTYCFSGQLLGGLLKFHLAQIVSSTTADEIQMMCVDEDVYDHPLKESDIIHSSRVIIRKGWIKLGEFNGGEHRSNKFNLWENLAKVGMTFDPIDVVLEKTWSCGATKKFTSFGALPGHIRRHSIKLKRKVSSIVKSGESFSTFENFRPIRRKRFMGIYMSIVNLLFSCMSASHCAISELGEAEGVARCLVSLTKGVRSLPEFSLEKLLLVGTWLDLYDISNRNMTIVFLGSLLHEAHLDVIGDGVFSGDGSNLDGWVVINIAEAASRDSHYTLQMIHAPATKKEELEVLIAMKSVSWDDTQSAVHRKCTWLLVVTRVLLQIRALEHGVTKLIFCCIFVISALRTRRLLSGRELIGTSNQMIN